MSRISTNINRAEMLRAIRRLINIGKSGLILITVRWGNRVKAEIRENKDKDWFKEIYTEEFLEQLMKLEEDVKKSW